MTAPEIADGSNYDTGEELRDEDVTGPNYADDDDFEPEVADGSNYDTGEELGDEDVTGENYSERS